MLIQLVHIVVYYQSCSVVRRFVVGCIHTAPYSCMLSVLFFASAYHCSFLHAVVASLLSWVCSVTASGKQRLFLCVDGRP